VARMVQRRNADGVLVRKPEEKRQLWWSHRWEDNNTVDFKNRMGWCKLNSASSVEGPVVVCCKHCNELSGSTKWREFLDNLRQP
jgi:hypothetical protein